MQITINQLLKWSERLRDCAETMRSAESVDAVYAQEELIDRVAGEIEKVVEGEMDRVIEKHA